MEKPNKNSKPFLDDMPRRVPMPLADRAKIFQPFEPLKGFAEALREQEQKAERNALAGDGIHRAHNQAIAPEDTAAAYPIWDEEFGWLS
ncbi:MAG: hypothetical protein SPD80_00210 [Atopobium sp.]|uniref:hypothetical protein n=1 Tax=Atopobium sp. TaxID=1872650 RepID=UPI002A7FE9D1|nr:hypothetical protein [Atopobium sp.]MDY4521999.1 hypothetical protein [Atopobium sp.]